MAWHGFYYVTRFGEERSTEGATDAFYDTGSTFLEVGADRVTERTSADGRKIVGNELHLGVRKRALPMR